MLNGTHESTDVIAEQNNSKQFTPVSIGDFFYYCITGNLEGVELSIQSLPLDLIVNSDEHMALKSAAAHGQLEVVNRLLQIEEFLLIASAQNNKALRLALYGNHILVADRLLEVEKVRKKAICHAAESGDLERMEKLLAFDAVKNDQTNLRDALSIAAEAGHLEILTCLLRTDVLRNNPFILLEALNLASKLGHLEIVNYLLTFDDFVKEYANCLLEAFSNAAFMGRLAVVNRFLEFEFIRNNQKTVFSALCSDEVEVSPNAKEAIMIRLLELEIVRNNAKALFNALYCASRWSYLKVVNLLLEFEVIRTNKEVLRQALYMTHNIDVYTRLVKEGAYNKRPRTMYEAIARNFHFAFQILEKVKTYAQSRVLAAVVLTNPELRLPNDVVTKILTYAFHDVMCGNSKCLQTPPNMQTKNAESLCPIITQFTNDVINCKKREKERIQKGEKSQEELTIHFENNSFISVKQKPF